MGPLFWLCNLLIKKRNPKDRICQPTTMLPKLLHSEVNLIWALPSKDCCCCETGHLATPQDLFR